MHHGDAAAHSRFLSGSGPATCRVTQVAGVNPARRPKQDDIASAAGFLRHQVDGGFPDLVNRLAGASEQDIPESDEGVALGPIRRNERPAAPNEEIVCGVQIAVPNARNPIGRIVVLAATTPLRQLPDLAKSSNFPVMRNVPQPWHIRVPVGWIRSDARTHESFSNHFLMRSAIKRRRSSRKSS